MKIGRALAIEPGGEAADRDPGTPDAIESGYAPGLEYEAVPGRGPFESEGRDVFAFF
jgi:hypothetical protein